MSLRSIGGLAAMRLWFGPPSIPERYGRPVHPAGEGNLVIARALAGGQPRMITRLGSSEVGVCAYYLRWRRGRVKLPYPAPVRRAICVNAGFFPGNDREIDRLAEHYLTSLRDADALAVWFNRGEERVAREHAPQAELIELTAMLSMLHGDPWSAALAGRRVLVVHPFAATIEAQYENHRERLFADARVLPAFHLQTLMPPQTIAGNTAGYANWFEALDATCTRIAERDFDVALIGAGAYGLPIAALVKRLGKQAVHLGGATQLLFGIKGRRWEVESADVVALLFNDAWVRPSAAETPEHHTLVEGGCYW